MVPTVVKREIETLESVLESEEEMRAMLREGWERNTRQDLLGALSGNLREKVLRGAAELQMPEYIEPGADDLERIRAEMLKRRDFIKNV